MTDELSNPEFWLQHGIQLCRTRVNKFNPKFERGSITRAQLQDELNIREQCYNARAQAHTFTGKQASWWRYMEAKAQLQVDWYARRISDAEYNARATALREQRDGV